MPRLKMYFVLCSFHFVQFFILLVKVTTVLISLLNLFLMYMGSKEGLKNVKKAQHAVSTPTKYIKPTMSPMYPRSKLYKVLSTYKIDSKSADNHALCHKQLY